MCYEVLFHRIIYFQALNYQIWSLFHLLHGFRDYYVFLLWRIRYAFVRIIFFFLCLFVCLFLSFFLPPFSVTRLLKNALINQFEIFREYSSIYFYLLLDFGENWKSKMATTGAFTCIFSHILDFLENYLPDQIEIFRAYLALHYTVFIRFWCNSESQYGRHGCFYMHFFEYPCFSWKLLAWSNWNFQGSIGNILYCVCYILVNNLYGFLIFTLNVLSRRNMSVFP